MKKLLVLFVLVGFSVLGCASTNVIPKDPTNYFTDGGAGIGKDLSAKDVEVSSTGPGSQAPGTPGISDPNGPDTTTGKPGWGYGDKNHEHSGPPGLDKRGTK